METRAKFNSDATRLYLRDRERNVMLFRSVVIAFVSAFSFGCSTAISGSNQLRSFPESVDVVYSADSPLSAANKIGQIFNQLHFLGNLAGGQVVTGDELFASAAAKSANGGTMLVSCQWIENHKTAVRFQSTLPRGEHNFVLKRISDTIGMPLAQAGER